MSVHEIYKNSYISCITGLRLELVTSVSKTLGSVTIPVLIHAYIILDNMISKHSRGHALHVRTAAKVGTFIAVAGARIATPHFTSSECLEVSGNWSFGILICPEI